MGVRQEVWVEEVQVGLGIQDRGFTNLWGAFRLGFPCAEKLGGELLRRWERQVRSCGSARTRLIGAGHDEFLLFRRVEENEANTSQSTPAKDLQTVGRPPCIGELAGSVGKLADIGSVTIHHK
jgi:hypothetical protein